MTDPATGQFSYRRVKLTRADLKSVGTITRMMMIQMLRLFLIIMNDDDDEEELVEEEEGKEAEEDKCA